MTILLLIIIIIRISIMISIFIIVMIIIALSGWEGVALEGRKQRWHLVAPLPSAHSHQPRIGVLGYHRFWFLESIGPLLSSVRIELKPEQDLDLDLS